MDVGSKDARYRHLVPATEYLTLDIRPDSGADIVGDLHDVPWESGSLDTVIATEVLEHCYDPSRAVGEIHRLLRPGNRVHAAWMMMPGRWAPVTWVVSLLTPLVASIDIPGSPNPCGYLVGAVK